jgi:hypothetical protein
MLGQCLLIGAWVARSFNMAVPLVVVSTYFFFIGLEGLKRARLRMNASETPLWKVFPRSSKLFLLASAALGATAVLGWDRWVLVFWGLLSLACVGAYAMLFLRRQERSAGAEWLGILGIALSAGVAWSAGTGRVEPEAFYVWGICFLYFAASVPYVRLRVKQMKHRTASLSSRVGWAKDALLYGVASLGLIAAGAGAKIFAWVMVIPFFLTLAKLIWVVARDRPPRSLAQVGYAEVFYSSVFTLLAVVAFW